MDKSSELLYFLEVMKESCEAIIYSLPFYEEADISKANQYISLFIEFKTTNFDDKSLSSLKMANLKFKEYLLNIFKRSLKGELRLALSNKSMIKILDLNNEFYKLLSLYDSKLSLNNTQEVLRLHELYLRIILVDSKNIHDSLDFCEIEIQQELLKFQKKISLFLSSLYELKVIYSLQIEVEVFRLEYLYTEVKYELDDFIELVNQIKKLKNEMRIYVKSSLTDSYIDSTTRIIKYYLEKISSLM